MLTVDDLRQQREDRSRVNHETYKRLFNQLTDRVRARAQNRGTSLVWLVPPFVLGRPLYNPAHAARYISEKLERGGFTVHEAHGEGVHVLYVTWTLVSTGNSLGSGKANEQPATDARPVDMGSTVHDASRTLEKLKARLRLS